MVLGEEPSAPVTVYTRPCKLHATIKPGSAPGLGTLLSVLHRLLAVTVKH